MPQLAGRQASQCRFRPKSAEMLCFLVLCTYSTSVAHCRWGRVQKNTRPFSHLLDFTTLFPEPGDRFYNNILQHPHSDHILQYFITFHHNNVRFYNSHSRPGSRFSTGFIRFCEILGPQSGVFLIFSEGGGGGWGPPWPAPDPPPSPHYYYLKEIRLRRKYINNIIIKQ